MPGLTNPSSSAAAGNGSRIRCLLMGDKLARVASGRISEPADVVLVPRAAPCGHTNAKIPKNHCIPSFCLQERERDALLLTGGSKISS